MKLVACLPISFPDSYAVSYLPPRHDPTPTRSVTCRRKIGAVYSWIFLFIAGTAFGVECIAHRGFAAFSPENTLEAIRSAWAVDADCVEVDIHYLTGGKLVLFHDEKTHGTNLSELTYSALQSLVSSYHIPTLAEALHEIPPNKAILLDLKSTSHRALNTLTKLIDSMSHSGHIRIQSSSLAALSHLRSRLNTEASFHLVSKLERTGWLHRQPSAERLSALLADAQIDGITAKGRNFIDREFVEAFKMRGIRFFIWTINDPSRMSHYVELGIDGVITDEPMKLNKVLSREVEKAR